MARARGRGNRAPFARATGRAAKKVAGSTDVTSTPLSVRTAGLDVGDDVRKSIRSRMGAKLGKYAGRIERLSVRFEDANGPRGGVDTVCRVKVVLSGLDSVVFESVGRDVTEATSLAAAGIERAVRRALGHAGGGARSSATRRKRVDAVKQTANRNPAASRGPSAQRRKPHRAACRSGPREPRGRARPAGEAPRRRSGRYVAARRERVRSSCRRWLDGAAELQTEHGGGDVGARRLRSRQAVPQVDAQEREPREERSHLRRRQIRRVTSPQARAARSARAH